MIYDLRGGLCEVAHLKLPHLLSLRGSSHETPPTGCHCEVPSIKLPPKQSPQMPGAGIKNAVGLGDCFVRVARGNLAMTTVFSYYDKDTT